MMKSSWPHIAWGGLEEVSHTDTVSGTSLSGGNKSYVIWVAWEEWRVMQWEMKIQNFIGIEDNRKE